MIHSFRFRSATRVALPVVMAACILALARDAAAQRRTRSGAGYESRVDTAIAFDKNGSVIVSVNRGEIAVSGWARNEVRVIARSDDDIRFSGSSLRVSLETAGNHRGSNTRFELVLPYGARVSASTGSGDIRVLGTRGPLEVHAQSGDVFADDVAGPFDVTSFSGDVTGRNISGDAVVNTVSGDVQLTGVRGNVDVSVVSGDIDLRGIAARLVRAKTTSGDVTFDGTIDPAGQYELGSHSGDIGLRVPRGASAQLTVATWSGSIDSQFPITLRPGEQAIGATRAKRYVFSIGGGGARISVEAFSGDVRIGMTN